MRYKSRFIMALTLAVIMVFGNMYSNAFASDSLPVISTGGGVEREATGEIHGSTGFIPYMVEGVFDPDKTVTVSKYARTVRPVEKQDVYGRTLPDYFYIHKNQLNANEQKLYDQMYANALALDPYFDVTIKVPQNRAFAVYEAMRYDNPDLFWVDTKATYSYDNNGYVTSFTMSFYSDMAGNIDAYKKVFYDVTESILEVAMTFDKDIDKVKYIHDLMTNLITYDLTHPWNQSAYSALCVGRTVCAGFTYAFQYLMQRLGIFCTVLHGNAWYWPGPVNAGSHVWNLIYIDGSYYETDVTWDNFDTYPDNDPHTYSYEYFNVTSGKTSSTHVRSAQVNGFPEANGTYYSYANYYGSNPGSDFTTISWANPRRSLPPLYPTEGSAALLITPDDTSGGTNFTQEEDDGDDSYAYEDDNYDWDYSANDEDWNDYGEYWTFDDVDSWIDSMDDDEWGELVVWMQDVLPDVDVIYDMEWDDFIWFMTDLLNSGHTSIDRFQYDLYDVVYGEAGYGWCFDEVENWLWNMSDDEWDELWNLIEELFGDDDEVMEWLNDMDWDEFVEFWVWWLE